MNWKSKVSATHPDQWPGPPKWGLTVRQWQDVNKLAWEYEHNGPLREMPGWTLDDLRNTNKRLMFLKWEYDNRMIGGPHDG